MTFRPQCKCGKKLIQPAGSVNASILLLGDEPSFFDTTRGYPFVVEESRKWGISPGTVLKQELAKAGLQMGACRATYLWRHEKNDCDIDKHKDWAAEEIAGKELVIAMGTEPAQAFFNYKIMDVLGLTLTHAAFPGTTFFFMPSPSSVFNSSIGEMNFAVQKLKELL